MKKTCFIILVSLLANLVPGKISAKEVLIQANEKIATVSPLFWGTNFLYWIEDDEALADGKIEKALKEMPCTVLRYPGGTVADNFHWKTASLDNVNMFPYESGPAESDFDEFMAFCARVGAEPMLVVNTQTWYLKQDIEGGAKEAADWVKYCKEKGYRVKYWEIGNETYWHPVMTAKEYGALVNVYAKAMKAVDPGIIISANGHWDTDMVGTKERVPSQYWEEIRKMYLDIRTTEEYKKTKEFYENLTEKPNTKGTDKWWNDVADACGENIDMISIHWYFFQNQTSHITDKIKKLEAFLKKKYPHKDYLICLSEYNCNEKDLIPRVLGFAEGTGRFLEAGVDVATSWPMRIGGMNMRSMLSLEDKETQYPYSIFKIFSNSLKGNLVHCKSDKDCYVFASNNGKEMTIFISGRQLKEKTLMDISIEGFKIQKAEANSYQPVASPRPDIKGSPVSVSIKKQSLLTVSVTPETFVIVKLTGSEKKF